MFLKIILLLGMLFCHIADDYYLQGWLALAKQKSWWKKNSPDELYKNDYLMALCEHAFSWTFMVMLIPALYMQYYNFDYVLVFILFFIGNWLVHCVTDHFKANLKEINLIQDQLIHILQVIVTWICLISELDLLVKAI